MSHATTYDEGGLSRFYTNVFAVMAIGLAITAFVAWLLASNIGLMSALFHVTETIKSGGKVSHSFSASLWWYAAAILELILVWKVASGSLNRERSLASSLLMFVFYCSLTGFTLSPLLYAYTSTSVTQVFLISSGMFGGCALWGATTKRNLLPLGNFFLAGLIGLLLVLVVSIFYHSRPLDMAISCTAVLLFAGLTAYDMQKLREMYEEDGGTDGLVVYGALSLYLDFINLFIYLLRIIGVRKD